MENIGRFESITWQSKYGRLLYEIIQSFSKRFNLSLRQRSSKIYVTLPRWQLVQAMQEKYCSIFVPPYCPRYSSRTQGFYCCPASRCMMFFIQEKHYKSDYPIPTVSRSDPAYNPVFTIDLMWRGPSWAAPNYFILEGLRQNNYTELYK